MTRAFLVPALLLAASCASGWRFVGAEDHAALVPGAQIATFERGRGAEHERRVEIRAGGEDLAATSVEKVMPYVKRPDTPEAAVAFSDLVRRLAVANSGAHGLALTPDPSLEGPGGSGRYSRSDATAWGIDFEPTSRANAGGFEVSRVVLLSPVALPALPRFGSPWRLVLVHEVVFPDGTIRFLDEKTLTNGQDAARFAAY
jgi:hypothetical protein